MQGGICATLSAQGKQPWQELLVSKYRLGLSQTQLALDVGAAATVLHITFGKAISAKCPFREIAPQTRSVCTKVL